MLLLEYKFELIDYASNREGQRVKRNNPPTFFADDVNDLSFEIRYRERDTYENGIANHDGSSAADNAGTWVCLFPRTPTSRTMSQTLRYR